MSENNGERHPASSVLPRDVDGMPGAHLTHSATSTHPFADAYMAAECIDRFTRNFAESSRRWEMVVYPSLFAFIVLAAYGFFLIYSLSHDISNMTREVQRLTITVGAMLDDMDLMAANMQAVSGTMDQVSRKMDALQPMLRSVESLDRSAQSMSVTTSAMGHQLGFMNAHMWHMNHNFTPRGMMTNFMRW
nr:DUF948 domain-containing protein [Gammaproteobacteria bacterium]